jgi:hypothetical protein
MSSKHDLCSTIDSVNVLCWWDSSYISRNWDIKDQDWEEERRNNELRYKEENMKKKKRNSRIYEKDR